MKNTKLDILEPGDIIKMSRPEFDAYPDQEYLILHRAHGTLRILCVQGPELTQEFWASDINCWRLVRKYEEAANDI